MRWACMTRSLFVLCSTCLLLAVPPKVVEPITIDGKSERINGWIGAVAFSPDGKELAIGDASGTINVWDVSRQAFVHQLNSQSRPISALSYTPDGLHLVSGGHDHTAVVYGFGGP